MAADPVPGAHCEPIVDQSRLVGAECPRLRDPGGAVLDSYCSASCVLVPRYSARIGTSWGSHQPEQARSVVLQDLRPHGFLDLELVEVCQPAVRLDARKVAPEQDLVRSEERGVGKGCVSKD